MNKLDEMRHLKHIFHTHLPARLLTNYLPICFLTYLLTRLPDYLHAYLPTLWLPACLLVYYNGSLFAAINYDMKLLYFATVAMMILSYGRRV